MFCNNPKFSSEPVLNDIVLDENVVNGLAYNPAVYCTFKTQ